jgi:hypothetical protein
MERESLRTGPTGSALIGFLSNLKLLDGPSAKPSFVQGMAQWLGWADAIPLSAALHAPLRDAVNRARAPASPAPAEREFEHVRAALLRLIDEYGTSAGAKRKVTPPDDDDFAPHRQRYARVQHAMQTAIEPLRAQARAAVASLSPQMERLAGLDAVMEPVLSEREQAALSIMPTLAQQHFDRLRKAAADKGAPWRDVFRKDMQRLLQAELELRLQPVRGLIEALRSQPQGTS